MRSFDEWEQAVVTARQERGEWEWTLAALAVEGRALGASAGQVGSALGISASRVRRLCQVWRAFPAEADRPPTLSLEHFVLAVATDDPTTWVARAADAGWSVRQLRDAITVEDAADACLRRREALAGAWRGFCNAWNAVVDAGDDPTTLEDARIVVSTWWANYADAALRR